MPGPERVSRPGWVLASAQPLGGRKHDLLEHSSRAWSFLLGSGVFLGSLLWIHAKAVTC